MLQFYTAEVAEGLHTLRNIPGPQGLVPKAMAVPTTARDRAVISIYAADDQVTGPAGFADMHSNVHSKFQSSLPIFGSARNWSTWYGPNFRDSYRRFDSPTSEDGRTLYILPGCGGFNSISRAVGDYQYRIMGNLDWLHPDALLEECYGIVLCDYWRWAQSATVRMWRTYYYCHEGKVTSKQVAYTRQWKYSAAISIFRDTDAQTLFDRFCPISDEMAEFAAKVKEEYDLIAKEYSDANALHEAEIVQSKTFGNLDIMSTRGKIVKVTTQITEAKARKASIKAKQATLRKQRDLIRSVRDTLTDKVSLLYRANDQVFHSFGVTHVDQLASDLRVQVRHTDRLISIGKFSRNALNVGLRGLRAMLDNVYTEFSHEKAVINQLYTEKEALYVLLQQQHDAMATLSEKQAEIASMPSIPPGFWDSATPDFFYYVQPSQAATNYLSEIAAYKEKIHELDLPNAADLIKKYREQKEREMVAELIRFKENYLSWISENPVSRVDYGKAVMTAVKDLKYVDCNSIAYLKDLPELFGEVKALFEVVKNPYDLTAWAGLLLSYSYGTQLTVKDTEELILGVQNALKKVDWSHSWGKTQGGRGLNVSFPWADKDYPMRRTVNATIYYGEHDSRFEQLLTEANNWDILPTASNMWDLVPYSFVVDWFVNVGQILEDMDTAWQALRLPLKAYLPSFRDRVDVPHRYVESICSSGQTISFTHYERVFKEELDLYMHPLEFSSLPPGVIPQATALLVQQAKRI